MRRLKPLLWLLALVCLPAAGQAIRFTSNVYTINSSAPQPGGLYPVLSYPGATVAVCSAPANAVPCTNYATTYTSASGVTACTAPTQLTANNSTTCTGSADPQGGWGVWIAAGTYQYTVVTSYGNFGPYDFSVGGSSSGGTVYPALPGVANCTGTPCVAWGTSFSSSNPIPVNFLAPSGTNGQILSTQSGVPTWIAPGGSTSPGGSVAYVQLTSPGVYTSCPTVVTFSGGGSPSAIAVGDVYCSMEGGFVVPTAVILSDAGYGYTSTPTVTISGGTGSGATAVAEMGSFVIALNTPPVVSNPAQASLENGILTIPYYDSTSQVPGSYMSVFGASGTAHSQGAVPDPGPSAGTARYLREDQTWVVPPGGSSAGSQYAIQTAGASGTFAGTGVSGIGVFSTSAVPRAAVFSDIVPLWGSGSCSGFLKSDGTCGSSSGGGSPGGALYNVQLYGAGATFSGSTNITADASSNFYIAGGYNGLHANLTDTTGNCGGNIFCNTIATQYSSTVGTNPNEDDNAVRMNNTFFGNAVNVGPVNGTGWTNSKLFYYTPNFARRGIKQAISGTFLFNGVGDQAFQYIEPYFTPGCGRELDAEGCTGITLEAQMQTPWVGTLASGGTNTAPNLTYASGNGTPVDGAFVVDTSSGITTALNGTATCCEAGEWSVPVTASSVTASTGICTTTGNLPNPGHGRGYEQSDTVAITCSVGSLSSTTNGGFATIVSGSGSSIGEFEQVKITSGGSSTVTLNHSNFHGTGSVIFQGGNVQGKVLWIDADYADMSTPSNYIGLGSLTGSDVIYCVPIQGSCSVKIPRTGETPETTTSTLHLYPYAENVTNTSTGSTPTLEPNNWYAVSSSTGDNIVIAPELLATGHLLWLTDVNNLPGLAGNAPRTGIELDYGGATASGAYMPLVINNKNAASLYLTPAGSGYMTLPKAAMQTIGPALNQIYLDAPLTYTQNPSGAEIWISDQNIASTYYAYRLLGQNTGDAIFSEINNTSSTQNGLLNGQRRYTIASLNVNLGVDPSIGPSSSPEFSVIENNRIAAYQPFQISATNVAASGSGLGAAFDVSTNLSVSGTPLNVAHFHANSTGLFIEDAPAEFTGLPTGTCTTGFDEVSINTSTGALIESPCGSGSSGISGLTTGYIPLAGSATTLTGNSHIDDGITTAATLTATEPIAITGSTHGLTIPAGTAVSGAAGKAVYASDASVGYAEVNENNTGLSRVCTAANGVCSSPTLPLSCQPGLGDGLNAIPAGTYLQTTCKNETGATWTLTAIRCVTDSGSSTCNVTNGAGTALLTGAITGSSTYANGTQSGTTTIASGDYLKITFVADGTTKQIGIDVAGTY